MIRSRPLHLGLLLWIFAPLGAHAQNMVMSTGENAVKFEMLHPALVNSNLSITSGAYYLGADIIVSDGLLLILELPFARSSQSFQSVSQSSSTIGNPYIGVATSAAYGLMRLDIGVRLPVAADDEPAAGFAAIADPHRLEAFVPEYTSLRASASLATGYTGSYGVFTAGTTVLVPSDGDRGDPELTIDYAGRALVNTRAVLLAAGLEGRFFATEDGSLGERTNHQAAISLGLASGRIRPGIQARVPLDGSLRDEVRSSLGVWLTINVN